MAKRRKATTFKRKARRAYSRARRFGGRAVSGLMNSPVGFALMGAGYSVVEPYLDSVSGKFLPSVPTSAKTIGMLWVSTKFIKNPTWQKIAVAGATIEGYQLGKAYLGGILGGNGQSGGF